MLACAEAMNVLNLIRNSQFECFWKVLVMLDMFLSSTCYYSWTISAWLKGMGMGIANDLPGFGNNPRPDGEARWWESNKTACFVAMAPNQADLTILTGIGSSGDPRSA